MHIFRSIFIGLGLFTLPIVLPAQLLDQTAGQAAPDSIVQLTAEAQGLAAVAPENLPPFGTFWVVGSNGFAAPYPCFPKDSVVPVYQMADGQFLVDGTDGEVSLNPRQTNATVAAALAAQAATVVALIEQAQASKAQRRTQTMTLTGGPMPPGGGGGTNVYYPNGSSYVPPDYGTNLYVAQVAITNGYLTGIASNTLADVAYELLTNADLGTTNWASTGRFIPGSETTNWTALPPLPVSGTGSRFFKLRSWLDSANVGIPDWWQLQFFGQVGIDPYALSPAGDGFTIWQKYQAGQDPNAFVTPPAPANFYAVLSTNGTDMLLFWSAAQGAVANYDLLRVIYRPTSDSYDYSNLTVNAGVTSWVDAGVIHPGDAVGNVFYTLTAVYPGGNTSQAAYASVYDTASEIPVPPAPAYNITVSAKLIRNGTGRWQLMFPALPPNVPSLNLIWADTNGSTAVQNISTNALTNGVYQIPDTDVVNYLGATNSVQGVGANGELGQVSSAGVLANDAPYFVDGRQHMKQNLEFLIRGASQTRPFFASHLSGEPLDFVFSHYEILFDPLQFQFNQSATNFEEFSFLHHGVQLDNLWPFTANYDLANYFIDATRTNPTPYGFTNFTFRPNFTMNIPAPPILAHADPYWILQAGFDPTYGYFNLTTTNWAVTVTSTQTVAGLAGGSHNLFGLPYQDGCEVDMRSSFPFEVDCVYQILSPGGSVTANPGYLIGDYASWCPAPTLQLTNYYFAPIIKLSAGQEAWPTPLDDAAFNITNQTPPVIIGAVGEPLIIGGWAKYAIQESSPAKYAYLGQYFETNAFLLDGSGNITTNRAGVLSPYGEFFPTQAGKAQLITLPDIDPPYAQGTCTVSIVSLTVDANHDGAMDLSWFGPDQTSPGKPYVFWCNNNFDRWDDDPPFGTPEQDDIEIGGDLQHPDAIIPDSNYSDLGGNRIIPDTRDLEDFSRLWINGVTPDLVSNLPAGSTVTLNWGDVGSPNYGNPTIDLFQASDGDGGLGYLTNETAATYQIDPVVHFYRGRVSPGQSLQLDANVLANYGGNHFIWCGVTNGTGKLTLTFADAGGHVLGQASVYLQIKDIKQMYERWTVGDVSTRPPETTAHLAQDNLPPGQTAFQYGPATTNTTYILHVHGYNMPTWAKARFAETEYKRLYWQGYQGRFGAFDWPTAQKFYQFGGSESQSWQSAQGLLNKLEDLNEEYPGQVYLTVHSLGNVAAGEALRLATNQVVNTYIAMQGAVSAHAYDPNTPEYTIPTIDDSGTPDCYANYWTNGAICYFNASAGAGTYVNFFNGGDFALSDAWLSFQNLKPSLNPGHSYIAPDLYYKNFGSTELFFPTDTYELFSDLIQSRSYALGEEVNVGGKFSVARQVDLPSVWPPDPGGYRAHVWHSAEFRSDNPQRWQFWNKVLVQMGLK